MNKVKATITFETELSTPKELKDISLYIERQLNLRVLDVEVENEI